jgi:hypothetical protein
MITNSLVAAEHDSSAVPPRAIIILWKLRDGTRCTVYEASGQWLLRLERGSLILRNAPAPSTDSAWAMARRWRAEVSDPAVSAALAAPRRPADTSLD